jgi:hypothetical protein
VEWIGGEGRGWLPRVAFYSRSRLMVDTTW